MGRGGFVGREREREQLDAGLTAALKGRGQVMLVAGEPGVGKSRLAEEIVERAIQRGMAHAWGRATDDEGSPPYWPFRQVIRALGGSGELVAPEGTAARERFELFEAVAEFLVAAAEPTGLLIVLDDLQWADSASVRLLVHLARGVARSRLAVLVTYRDTEVRESLRAALAALTREPAVIRTPLAGLTELEVALQLRGVTGWAVPDSVTAAVCRRTRGNPFFVGELGRLLADGEDSAGGLPDGVRDAVRGRLARVSPECRSIVSAAAVLGSEPDPAALAEATGTGLGEVLAVLDEAAAAQLVTGRFTHDLIREAARLEVPTAKRLALHQRMAEYLSGRADADRRVAEIAFHWLESLPAGDPRQAVSWTERAADQAIAQLAWEDADSLYARALAAATGPGFDTADRCRLLLAGARARVRAYDVDGARQSLLAAAELAREAGDANTLAQASLVMEGVSDFLWDPRGRALCAEALAGLPDGDSAVRARLLAQRVVADSWRSDVPADVPADVLSKQALAMAERVGDRRAIVEALRARQIACGGPEGAADRIELGDRLLAIGRDGDDDAVLWGQLWRFDAYCQLGELDQAEVEWRSIGATAERMRSPLARWHAVRSRAALTVARGRFAEAVALSRQAMELAERAGHDGAVQPSVGLLLLIRAQTGDATVAPDELVERFVIGELASLRAIHAGWMLILGRRDEARRLYRTLPPPRSVPRFVLISALGGIAELAAEFGDAERAKEVYELLSPFAELFVCGGAGVVAILGSARLPLGRAAATMGRLDDAVRHLRAAAEIHERAGMPPYAAISRYHLASVLARRRHPGDRDEAAALATATVAVAEALGMAPLRDDAAKLAATLAGRAAGGPLTRRETEIATLVSQGLSNRQIAASAFISERTVETHVQHILGKLGFSARTQIAAWVVEEKMRTEHP